MGYIAVTPIKDEQWFRNLKRQVFLGEVEPDGFDTIDYKYFDKIRELGIKYRTNEISKEEFKAIDDKYYAEYEEAKESYLEHLSNAAMIINNIKRSEALRIELYKTKSFETALEIIELLTAEQGLKDRVLNG